MNRLAPLVAVGALILVLSSLATYGPAFASTGTTTLFVTDSQTSITAGHFQDASSSISVPGGSAVAADVNGAAPSVSPAYFALNLTSVTFSGVQFYLLLSTNGLSQKSPTDIQFAGPFSVSQLSAAPALVNGYYIGKSGGTSFISGPLPSGEAGGVYYVKIWDGSSTSISVSQQVVIILPSIKISPTSGPAGATVTVTGYGFTSNGVVNLTVQNSTTSPIRMFFSRNITASAAGNFTWSATNSSNFRAPDLGKIFNGNPVVQPEGTVYYRAYDWSVKYTATAQTYTEYYREFMKLLAYSPVSKSYLPPSGSGPWGNGTTLIAYTYQPFNVTGDFFNPSSNLSFTLNDKSIVPVYLKSVNGSGYFVANFTTPDLAAGVYNFKVIDSSGTMVVPVQVIPSSSVIPQVTLKLSYSVTGGGTGFSPPVFSYVANGTVHTQPLTTTPVSYRVDKGTIWNVTNPLVGSTPSEAWRLNQPPTGTASSNATIVFAYYQQFLVTFSYGIGPSPTQIPPGGGPINPAITYTSFGTRLNTTVGMNVWADALTPYQYQNPVLGPMSGERYSTPTPTGTISTAGLVQNTYYNQFQVYFGYVVNLGGSYTPPTVAYLYYNQNTTTPGNFQVWVDAGSYYVYPSTLAGSTSSERWYATSGSSPSGSISSSVTLSVIYAHQFYVTITNSVPSGGSVSPASGWYNANSILLISATPAQGWAFGVWTGTGSASYTGVLASTSFPITSAVTEAASFYPGITITAGNGGSVTYSYGTTSGTVYSGQSRTLYLPSGAIVTITAHASSLLQAFKGWSGVTQSSSESATLTVDTPGTVTASFGTNYTTISIIVGLVAIAVVVAIILVLRLTRGRTTF